MAPKSYFNSLFGRLVLFFVITAITGNLCFAQSIFRDRRDSTPIIPTIVPPEGPVLPGEEPMVEEGALEDGEVIEGEQTEDGEPLVALPVKTEEEIQEEALNREREEAANVSSPGVVALFRQAGKLDALKPKPPTAEEVKEKLGANAPGLKTMEDSMDEKLASTFMTQADARTFTFSIPAPRGQILDRNGKPLAQNKVVNYAAIEFPQWGDEPDDTEVMKFAAERIHHVNNLLGTNWDLDPKIVRSHYLSRRWMPLLFSGPLTKKESEKLGKARVDGLQLIPVYLRHYPNEMMLSHVIGYVGKRPPRSTGVITSDEPIWGSGIGVQGLELAFDEELTGTPGRISQLWDGKGNKVREDTLAAPRPGNNVVTTIDIDMQRLAERLLRQKTHRGAMVVMNCNNGDVMALASYPQYNPNDFIPSISQEKYTALLEDKEKPLFGRAFQGGYPPASTFKVASALAFLEEGYISTSDVYPCPSSWTIGNLTMRNWNSQGEGHMNVVSALARSCNTWFYEISITVGGDAMSSMSNRLGLGEKTGLPLPETPGFIPNNRYWIEKYGYQMSDGDEANMSIGQGRVKTTPIQIARMMAAIGNQESVFNARLIKQIQDVNHNVVKVFNPEVRNALQVGSYSLAAVRKGMYNVVNASYGTGKAGAHPITVSAKTGTGQWITSERRNIAWFAGYFPARNPVYSFSIVYEGQPGEAVSGGRKAAPIIHEFMEEYLTPQKMAEVRRMSAEMRG
ncbi:MAG: penicillin-binding transpeptidase domain-containing protein, partial [Verrucomicrobiales bacterium]|nr:penicillin-binding transpeptidase domain-containing protein [Verrucomicrobiales bacterium]